jgi:hypothetical protein
MRPNGTPRQEQMALAVRVISISETVSAGKVRFQR